MNISSQDKPLYSVVCVYSNVDIFEKYLLLSLKLQTAQYEPIFIDNCVGQFKSAAVALNYGGRQANSKYIMFVHQDVDFESATWLADASKILDSLPEFGVAGVAGISTQGHGLKEKGRNIIIHGPERIPWEFGNPINSPEVVQTLDCCVLIVPQKVFEKIQFDEKTCDSWHLYGEDYCLQVGLTGLKAYVLPFSIYHASRGVRKTSRLEIVLSLGALPREYYVTLKKLLAKYRGKYEYIYTTNGEWNTTQPVMWQRITMLIKGGVSLLQCQLKGKIKK